MQRQQAKLRASTFLIETVGKEMFIKGKKGSQIGKCEKKLVRPFNLEDRTIFEPLPAFPKRAARSGKLRKG